MSTHNPSAYEKFVQTGRDALLVRKWGGDVPSEISTLSGIPQAWNPSAGRRERRLQSFQGLARQCLIFEGADREKVENLSVSDLARAALGFASPHERFAMGFSDGSGPSYNTTGTFPAIVYDASNVIARRAYMEAKSTFQIWMQRREDVRDFKDIHSTVLGEISDPRVVPEDGEFEESYTLDSEETYKLTVWGHIFSLTWQTVINDQPGAFLDLPRQHGQAMRRKQNKLAYAPLNGNPVLSDGGALFNANAVTMAGGHDNLITAGAPPSVATLNVGYQKMMQQKGLLPGYEGGALNVEPAWLIHTPGLRGTALELIGSTSNPAGGNSGAKNVWYNQLQPITESQLGAAAGGVDERWFLASDHRQMEHIEYAFLEGLDEPAIDVVKSFDRLALRHRIYQAFGICVKDFRGLFANDGVT